jgi:hypothetical protein
LRAGRSSIAEKTDIHRVGNQISGVCPNPVITHRQKINLPNLEVFAQLHAANVQIGIPMVQPCAPGI